jgi:predicted RND superfamily exporter protein
MVVFLLLTVVFAGGATMVTSEVGTSSFTEDNPAQEALESVNQEFSPSFGSSNGTTQLLRTAPDVLSKTQLLYMLEAQERLSERPSLEVIGTQSAAQFVAREIDPSATTIDAQIEAIERSTPAEIEAAVGRAAETPGFSSLLIEDFNPQSASASGAVTTVSHDIEVEGGAGQGGDSPLTPIQLRAQDVVSSVGGDIRVFGSGITSAEFGNIIGDSLLIVTPAAVVLILVFLVFSYRDPIDLLLGIVSLVMALIWTFGFMGITGIPFSQLLIAIPPLLLAVGIDFGIHAINRYHEERVQGWDIDSSMRIATDQLLVAFFIVTGTTVFGFGSNIISDLQPTRQFGIVAAVGIVFTFLIFGIFLPAAKVWADRLRDAYGFLEFGMAPLGEEGSIVGRVLTIGVTAARKAPYAVLVLALLVTVVGGFYATDIRSSFSNEDFLPPEDNPDYVQALPEPFAPSEYSVTETTNYLEDNFASGEEDTVTIYVEGPLRQDNALEQIQRANRNPPDSFIGGRTPEDEQSIITVIQGYAEQSPEFRRLVDRNDADDDGVPEDNLERVYNALLDSPAPSCSRRSPISSWPPRSRVSSPR